VKFIHSVVAQNEAVVKNTTKSWDLPVNPLSHLIITIRALNAAAVEATKFEIEDLLKKVSIDYRGITILDLSGVELDTYNALTFKNLPVLLNQVATDDAVRALTLVVPFGRKIFDPEECFPGSRRGELTLHITYNTAAATPNIDGCEIQIESVALPEATPKQYIKNTTLTKTPTAVGWHEIDLPIGNQLIGIGLHATTTPIGISWDKSISQVKVMADNDELDYTLTNWESLHGMLLNKIGHREPYDLDADHDHYLDSALLDFDPQGDSKFLIDTKPFARFNLAIYADVADQILVHPIEIVKV